MYKQSACRLSRSLPVEIDGDEGVEDIRDPRRHARRYIAADGEGRGDGHEEDIRGAKPQSDTDVHAHAALYLTRGERCPDGGQDESRHDRGESLVILDLEGLDIAYATLLLPVDIGVQLWRGHRLAVVDGDQEVGGDDRQGRVHAGAVTDLLAHPVEVADHVVDHRPLIERVILDRLRREA